MTKLVTGKRVEFISRMVAVLFVLISNVVVYADAFDDKLAQISNFYKVLDLPGLKLISELEENATAVAQLASLTEFMKANLNQEEDNYNLDIAAKFKSFIHSNDNTTAALTAKLYLGEYVNKSARNLLNSDDKFRRIVLPTLDQVAELYSDISNEYPNYWQGKYSLCFSKELIVADIMEDKKAIIANFRRTLPQVKTFENDPGFIKYKNDLGFIKCSMEENMRYGIIILLCDIGNKPEAVQEFEGFKSSFPNSTYIKDIEALISKKTAEPSR